MINLSSPMRRDILQAAAATAAIAALPTLAAGELDPRKDVAFVESWEGVRLLAEGKVDATLGFPPEPHIMRDKKIGVSLVNTAIDRPWSQYFCCMAIGNRDFVAKNPAATKCTKPGSSSRIRGSCSRRGRTGGSSSNSRGR
jgi:NitT/TauT family transport system substrate-binding protein